MTLASRLQQLLLPGRIIGVQVAFSRAAVLVEAEDGIRCGLASTHTDQNPLAQNPIARQTEHFQDLETSELAALCESDNVNEAAIGYAAINALLPRTPERWQALRATDYLFQNGVGKNVALIGRFPFQDRLKLLVKQLWILETNLSEEDEQTRTDFDNLQQADLVALPATTLIDKTFDRWMSHCRQDATVIMIGTSTPLSPVLYDFGVQVLSGAIVDDPQKTFPGIGQGLSMHHLRETGWVQLITMKKEGDINGKFTVL